MAKEKKQFFRDIRHDIHLTGVGNRKFGTNNTLRISGTPQATIQVALLDPDGNHVARREFTAAQMIRLLEVL